ncbi:hypothetical protein [Cellvibrio japonicus]|uniref:Mannosidase-like protein n=2 Tax=Cellvibrio japonicus TaxID=155077 RepID=B3PEE1_CELJU|nr:hypothetical protein [Cellvibrio japonicus]ACE86060.1 mannosidase-like protein [Cellvibrio japonicus Ueda107]QEI13515.1 hypothetical protein FY117_15670 [Cellvibrio japonicus]QEI17089.1 hypothetical protein FY116_15675 [Cellvibrio japonicus]
MRTKISVLSAMVGMSLLSACGGGSMLSQSDSEKHKLIPDVVVEDPMAARPSENAPVMKIDSTNILSADGGNYVLPVGIVLDYGADSSSRYDAIEEIAKVSAGAIRLIVTPETPVQNLEAALNRASTDGLMVNLTLHDPALYCKDNGDELLRLTKENWFGKFLPVIAQDRYQAMLMISIARGWGPVGVFNPASAGYRSYMDYTKTMIRDFRKRGFKLPLVIEAPGCGEDYNVFDGNRVRELLASDTEKNLIIGLAAKGANYLSSSNILNAANVIRNQRVPVLFTEVGGSDVVEDGVKVETLLDTVFGNTALVVNPEWQGPNEKVAYLFPFAQTQNLKNTQLSFDINFAETYVNAEYLAIDGVNPMGFQIYLRDVNDNYANIKWHSIKDGDVNKSGWQNISYTIGANMPNTGWVSDGFDMTQVVAVGIELAAQDKPASVAGPIKLDNFRLIEGSGPAIVYASDFSAGNDGWVNSQWQGKVAEISTVSGDTAEKALSLIPQDDVFEITRPGLNLDLTQPVTIKARIYIPASITNFGLGIFAANAANWAGGGWAGTWNLTPGQWSDYSYTTDANASDFAAFAASGGNGLGFQFSQFAEDQQSGDAILIEDIQIISAAGSGATETEAGTQYRTNFSESTDGWVNTGWPDSPLADLVVATGEMSISTRTNGSGRITINKGDVGNIANLNLDGDIKITVTAFFPESLRNKEFNFQVFLQDANWSNHTAPINLEGDEMVYGEWHTYSVDVELPEGFDVGGKPRYLGIDMLSTSFETSEKIIVSSLVVEGPVPVEAEDVVLGAVDFNREQLVFVDFVDGAITPEQALKVSSEVISNPIGWFASTWYAARSEEAGYDLVLDMADSSTLTERGEVVVSAPGGLAEMRSLLMPDDTEVLDVQ